MTTPISRSGETSERIREAERADLLEVVGIERESFPQPWPYQAFTGFLGEPGFLVADRGESTAVAADRPAARIAGYIVADTVSMGDARLGHIKDLAVRPGSRGRGLGTSLLQRGLSVLAASGATMAKLEVRESNEPAQNLYSRFGFRRERVVEGYYADGEDALVLATVLPATEGGH